MIFSQPTGVRSGTALQISWKHAARMEFSGTAFSQRDTAVFVSLFSHGLKALAARVIRHFRPSSTTWGDVSLRAGALKVQTRQRRSWACSSVG
jgi:hypothetical protein